MPPESAKFLRDMLDCAGAITEDTQGKKFSDYETQRWLRDTVQWNFAIIGEALSQLHKLDSKTAERISDWNRIICLRNQLIHGYGVVDHRITWRIIEEKLPILRRELEELLSS